MEESGVADDNVAAIVQIDYTEQNNVSKKIKLDTNSEEHTTCYAELLENADGDSNDTITIKVSKQSKSSRDTAIGDSSVLFRHEAPKTYYKPKGCKRGRKPLFVSNPGLFEEFKRNYEQEQKLKAQDSTSRGLSNGKVLSKTRMTNEDEGITTVVVCQPLSQQTKEVHHVPVQRPGKLTIHVHVSGMGWV